MPGFLNRTAFDVYDEGRGEFVLLQPLSYESLAGERFVVPAGFLTDFSSYPFIARAAYGVNDDTRYAAVLHDYLYRTAIVTRREADDLYYEAMGFAEVRGGKRWLLWAGLRAGGWLHYGRSSRPLTLPSEHWPKYGLERLHAFTDSPV